MGKLYTQVLAFAYKVELLVYWAGSLCQNILNICFMARVRIFWSGGSFLKKLLSGAKKSILLMEAIFVRLSLHGQSIKTRPIPGPFLYLTPNGSFIGWTKTLVCYTSRMKLDLKSIEINWDIIRTVHNHKKEVLEFLL